MLAKLTACFEPATAEDAMIKSLIQLANDYSPRFQRAMHTSARSWDSATREAS